MAGFLSAYNSRTDVKPKMDQNKRQDHTTQAKSGDQRQIGLLRACTNKAVHNCGHGKSQMRNEYMKDSKLEFLDCIRCAGIGLLRSQLLLTSRLAEAIRQPRRGFQAPVHSGHRRPEFSTVPVSQWACLGNRDVHNSAGAGPEGFGVSTRCPALYAKGHA